MKRQGGRRRWLIVGFVFLFFSFGSLVWARESMGTPAAKAEFEKGETARKASDYTGAAAAFRRAIELDPDFAAAHENFIFMTGLAASRPSTTARPKPGTAPDAKAQAAEDQRREEDRKKVTENLERLYDGWSKEHPDKAGYLWGLGNLNYYKNRNKAEKYFLAAIKVDPLFARAYQWLSLVAETRGDDHLSIEYLKKATKANPDDPSYAFYYAHAVRKEDPKLSRKLSIQVADRFPKSGRGAQSLYWLAADTENQTEKITVLERLKHDYPPAEFDWSSNGMSSLFDIYLKTDANKAVSLSEEMVKATKDDREVKSWQGKDTFAKNMIRARALLEAKDFPQAKQLLDSTKAPSYTSSAEFSLLKAEVDDALGETARSYEAMTKLLQRAPNDDYQAAASKYGAKLKRTAQQVEEDIWKLRYEKATPAKELGLENFYDGKKVFLADYRGRVVLVNFWYPG